MAASVAITPASGSITATVSACRIDIDGAEQNDLTAYDAGAYPTAPERRYYITAEESTIEYGRSHVFSPNGGKHEWNGYIFPHAGSWTVHLRNVSDDSSEANLAVTVS
jgi:hypothetical protein